jgi:hypothetical protein
MRIATYGNFQRGIVDDPSVEDQGGFEFASGMDIFSEPGVLKACLAMEAVTRDSGIGTLNALPLWMVDVAEGSSTRTYICFGSKIIHSNSGALNSGQNWELFITNSQGTILGMAAWAQYLAYASETKLGRVAIHNAATQSDSYASLNGDPEHHPMFIQGGALKIGDGRYVDSLSESYVFSNQVMKVPHDYRVKCLADIFGKLIIGTKFGAKQGTTTTHDASSFGWRGTVLSSGSALPDEVYPLKLRGMHALIYDGQALYGFPDQEGDIYIFDGARFKPYRKLFPTGINNYLEVYPGAVGQHFDTLLFAGESSWSPGVSQMKDGIICQSFVPSQASPLDASPGVITIGFVKQAYNGRVFIGYYRATSSTYHIEVTSQANNRQNNAKVRTLWHRVGTDKLKRWYGLKLNLKPMTTSTAVSVAYRTGRDQAFTSLAQTVTPATQDKPILFPLNPRTREIQFELTYTSYSTGSPELLSYDLLYDIINSIR